MAGIDFRPRRTFFSTYTGECIRAAGATNFSFCPLTRVFVPLCVHALNFRLRDFFIFVQSAYPRPSASVHRPFRPLPPLSLSLSLSLLPLVATPFFPSVLLLPRCKPVSLVYLRTRARFVFRYFRGGGGVPRNEGDGSSSTRAPFHCEKRKETLEKPGEGERESFLVFPRFQATNFGWLSPRDSTLSLDMIRLLLKKVRGTVVEEQGGGDEKREIWIEVSWWSSWQRYIWTSLRTRKNQHEG